PAVRHYLLGLETALDAEAGGGPQSTRPGGEGAGGAGENGRGPLAPRHYLLGLETALDAEAGGRPKRTRSGSEATWDAGKIGSRLLTLGFYAVPWERAGAAEFDPGHWTPSFPNSAFAHRTTRDGYWGAKRVGGISPQQIAAAVWAAQPSDSIHAQAVIAMLQARRTATLRYWYGRVTPLDEPALRH